MKTLKKLFLFILSAALFCCAGCGNIKSSSSVPKKTGQMDIHYAKGFAVDYIEGGYSTITIGDDQKFCLVPKNKETPKWAKLGGYTVLKQPLENIYLAASSAMDLFLNCGAQDNITMTGTKKENWSSGKVRDLIDSGKIYYAGKYNKPDFEMILEKKCSLAIESTMIYHTPEVKEKLEETGIPVMVEKSSYEALPLARLEWIKLWGLVSGNENKAESFFEKSEKTYNAAKSEKNYDRKVAVFYVSQNGYCNVRKPGDYLPKMIEDAGGEYAFKNSDLKTDENALSTCNISMETFYSLAKNSDILIYNATVTGKIDSKEDLLQKSKLFSDFKAYKNDEVYCTENNFFQDTGGIAELEKDINKIISGKGNSKLKFLYKI